MDRKPIRIRIVGVGRDAPGVKSYFRRPLNIALISVLVMGVVLVSVAHGIHPELVNTVGQKQAVQVTPNIIYTYGSFAIYPNETTDFTFTFPENSTIHYYLYALVKTKVTPSPTAPSGYQTLTDILAHGDASNGTTIHVNGTSLAFPLSSSMSLYSLSGGSFYVNVDVKTVFRSTLSFDPPLAIAGLVLSTGSLVLIATISGVRREEL